MFALHAQQPAIAIRAGAMVDVERGRLIEGATVIVQGGRIVAAGARTDVRVPADAARVDLPTATLLPGLIDAHVHLTLGGPPAANARATLAAGFTTVQDLGAAAYANVALRDAIAAGRVEGPRVVASGPWLGITGGTCDFNGIGVHGADAFRARVRDDVARGADLIKVCVSGWLADAVKDPAKYEIADEELSAAVEEAHRLGKRVAVHALSEGGIGAAVRLGADLVVHAGFPSRGTVVVMKERGVQQLPTLFSLENATPQDLSALHTHMRGAVTAGLPIAFGTDAGVIPHGTNAREFERLAAIGLDAPAALRAATVSAARAVGMAGDIGVLAAGRLADVIGVEGNPLQDLRTLQRVTFVMKEGKVFKGASLAPAQQPAASQTNPNAAATAADHKNMIEQLGITALRPGPSGNESAPNHANYDESLANPYPNLPDALTLANGTRVTSAEMWWKQRRPEIVENFDREVLGRVPRNVPPVVWRVSRTERFEVGGRPVVGKELIGTADNSAFPDITVAIQMTLVTPANAARPVPVMMMFGGRSGMPPAASGVASSAPGDPPAIEQLIADGWGYATIAPGSIQADHGAGLTSGIIGLVNRGQRRRPDDWGALRAWAWGASRGLDYLETDTAVDAKKVGIEGVSRFGKAALVTMAYDQRFAVVLIGSSGEGGAKLHRRNFGEAVENLTGAGEYHWMAGNFLKYGAEQSTFGRKTAADLPVDAHELLALCAPRPTFISYGIPERGDARWLDQQGSFMAAVAAQPVFRLLGAKGLGVSDDYLNEKMPAVNAGLLDGQLAWRQHDGGHTDGPNWKYFIPWADKFLTHSSSVDGTADRAAPRTDENSMTAHAQLLEKAKQGRIDVYFIGDSIVRRWGALDYPELLANWRANFFGWHAANFGWGADRTQNILWRLEHGELDGVNPKVIVVLAGTNNVGTEPRDERTMAEIARGINAIVDICRQKAPNATIVLTAIFPRHDNVAVMPTIDKINAKLAASADGTRVRFLSINDRLVNSDGQLVGGVLNERDKLHPTIKGYQIWADALKPILRELLGPPGTTDLAPPPTGDPSAARPR